MITLNKRIQGIKGSATLILKEKADKLIASGRKIINLGPGEPDIDTPDHIKEAAYKAIREGKTKYLAVAGLPALRAAIANKLVSENKIPVDTDSVIVTNGGKQAILSAMDVVLEPGDEVIIPAPYWVSYPEMAKLAGGVPVIIPSDPANRYRLKPEVLKNYITPRSRILILNSPSNPSGASYSKQELEGLSELIIKHNLTVISDEVYEKIVYDGYVSNSIASLGKELAERTITVNALSKTYSMTGWRVGYAAGPKHIISAMIRHQGQTTSNVCSIAQYAGLAAVTGDHSFLPPLIESYRRRRDLGLAAIENMTGCSVVEKPEGAFFLFIRCEKLFGKSAANGSMMKSSQDLANLFLEDAGVALLPGVEFGDDGAIRISYALSDSELKAGLDAMVATIRKLN
jgi:aspartate aminotransferase